MKREEGRVKTGKREEGRGKREEMEETRDGREGKGRCQHNNVSGYSRHVFSSLFPLPFKEL
jgi:hypothetical protein